MRTFSMSRSTLAVWGLAAILLAIPVNANANNTQLLGLMQGTWKAALSGNTGCGVTSAFVTFTLDANGSGAGTAKVVMHSTGCVNKVITAQDFSIDTLGSGGTGTAHLTCGVGCAWAFMIQVEDTGKVFILTDVNAGNPQNTPTGTAIRTIQ